LGGPVLTDPQLLRDFGATLHVKRSAIPMLDPHLDHLIGDGEKRRLRDQRLGLPALTAAVRATRLSPACLARTPE
jgi:hypothetical protein